MPVRLKSLVTPRFFKFCTVGLSGVLVNMACFFVFSDVLHIHVHAALAMAIEISILSNFSVNEAWTFRDRHDGTADGRLFRVLKFHTVSLVGGAVQWCTFAAVNAVILRYFLDPPPHGAPVDFISRYVTQPADAGYLKYLAQLVGIGTATFFNFALNVKWTWGRSTGESHGN